jgi:hypothetical protein
MFSTKDNGISFEQIMTWRKFTEETCYGNRAAGIIRLDHIFEFQYLSVRAGFSDQLQWISNIFQKSKYCLFVSSYKGNICKMRMKFWSGNIKERDNLGYLRVDGWIILKLIFFSPHHHVQTGSGAHPASHPMGTGSSFPGSKAVGT